MKQITERLFEAKDEKYKAFHSSLIPNISPESIIGVRTPQWRKLAKEIVAEGAANEFLSQLPHRYLEENNIHAAIICNLKCSFEETVRLTEEFLPYIDNWATCDSFTPKNFKKYPEKVYPYILKWLKSDKTYTVRFAVVLLLNLFLDEYFNPEINDILSRIETDEYYINMAIAWYYSFALIKQYNSTITFFTEKRLPVFVHNKAIQKAVESYRIPKETKEYLKLLKIRL